MHNPIHFSATDFVPPETWYAEKDASLMHMHDEIIASCDQVWEFINSGAIKKYPIVINNWASGGELKYCGYRPENTPLSVGAKKSAHRHNPSDAVDLHVLGIDANDVRQMIIKNQSKFPFIKRIERDVEWVHIDRIVVQGSKGIYLFKA